MFTSLHALAALSTGIYFSGLTYFKLAAAEMRPLRGDRPLLLTRELLGSRTWLAGASVLGVGAAVQVAALTRLSLFQAQPMFLAGLAILLVLAIPVLRERLTPREWGCVALLAIATALFAHAASAAPAVQAVQAVQGVSVGHAASAGLTGSSVTGAAAIAAQPDRALVVAVALPSLLVPCIGFLTVDLAREGAHARPLTGVALAVNAGLLTGTAEMMLTGAAGLGASPRALLTAPYLYAFAVAAPLALGQLQIALQRSRLAIVGLVATATAKTYLLIVATTLYGERRPDDGGQTVLALALSVLAVAAVPHHERRAARARLQRVP
ncbi:hypothetical protein [Actinomadura latina]|uniref:Uncharacterized protein n=1 Tax=Actinomadura latina TaxID=163603 RepID=A0A846YVY5_9ACTN|nr:hypothetical protein [Actinomadura latina]NKZ02835.1 hypothetical protein [Actinomadura latina]